MHHAAAPLEPSRQRHLHRGRSLNQSDQSKTHMSLAEAARVEKARGGSWRVRVNPSESDETGDRRAETGKKGMRSVEGWNPTESDRIQVNQTESNQYELFPD
jgi:hypothetical protein